MDELIHDYLLISKEKYLEWENEHRKIVDKMSIQELLKYWDELNKQEKEKLNVFTKEEMIQMIFKTHELRKQEYMKNRGWFFQPL